VSEQTWWINFEALVKLNDFSVYMVCREFNLPTPEENGCTNRIAFTKAVTKLNDRQFTALFDKLSKVDAVLARRVQEDVIETMASLLDFDEECDEIQEYTVRDLSVQDGEKCE